MSRTINVVAAWVLAVAGVLAQAGPSAGAASPPQLATPLAISPSAPTSVLTNPASVLGPGWQHSADRAVAVAGDANGLHVLTANEAGGYSWRVIATLRTPGVDTAQWIGRACLTGDGTRAVVVFAPAEVTNDALASGFGARAAIVNLVTGGVTPISAPVSIAYFDPGCGTGNQVVLTQGGWGAAGNITGSVTVRMALPNYGANAIQAIYQVVTGKGKKPILRPVHQGSGVNHWFSLGTFEFSPGAQCP